ncbi:hypothetical protein NL108_004824 [Boleophthalmus pectinirostris]|nr:hypothetical protein NL108_004824 [Boleophthalmus pectinirostris]
MANFLSGALGGQGIARMVGEKAGDFVEDAINKAMGGNEKESQGDKGSAGGSGGFDVGDVLSFGDNKEKKSGLDIGDALSFVGDSKDTDKREGGLDLSGIAGNLFK